MRTYYIFLINNEIFKLTRDKSNSLYKLLESIYLLDKDKILIGYNTFSKVCNAIPKKNVNKLLNDNCINDLTYTCFKNTHIINDYLNDESTKLIINTTHIKIKTNKNYPYFFNKINKIPNLFVCDFENNDYFYLKDIVYNR